MLKDIGWWYWAVSVGLLALGIFVDASAFEWLILLTAIQLVHFIFIEKSVRAFSVQIRIAFLILVSLFYIEPLRILYWIPLIGVTARTTTGYCFMARCLSLLPWNRHKPLTMDLIRRTFLSKPTQGTVLGAF
jgi:hypothetical protein